MNQLILTLIVAFIIIIVALSLLGISWLITGKSKIKPGACGRLPGKNKDDSCENQSTCDLCHKPENQEKR